MENTNRVNRRSFLRQSALALGALGIPQFVPSFALGKQGGVAPSERIVLGFIGTGKQSKGLMNAFLNKSDTQVVAGCDVDKLKLARSKKITEDFYAKKTDKPTFKGYECYGDFRELTARSDIDAVVIATPDHWHALNTVQAARAGKDIYCEKPLSWSIDEGKAMVKAVQRYRRIFQTGSMQRSDEKFRFACELVRNGYIGDIKHIIVNIGGPPGPCDLPAEPQPDYLDWNMWVGPAHFRPYNHVLSPHISEDHYPRWRDYIPFGGGAMTDWGAHHFDIAQWGLGMDRNGPVEVVSPDQSDFKVLTYRYANGVTMVRDDKYEGKPVKGVLFIGSKGKVEVNRSFLRTWPEELIKQKLSSQDIHLYKSTNHQQDFLQAMRTRKQPICDVEIGFSTVVVCHLGNIVYRIKRSLKWDPQKLQLAQPDSEAQQLFGRTMRSPWRL